LPHVEELLEQSRLVQVPLGRRLFELPDRGPGEVAFFPALDLVTGLANLYRKQGNAAKAQHKMQEYKRLQEKVPKPQNPPS
jgi:hypothetical protein